MPSSAGTAAWLWMLPCAALTVALVALLGRPLSHVLYGAPLPVLPTVEHNPEPLEDTRYLLSLAGPVLLAAGIVALASRLRVPRRAGLALAALAQAVGVAVLAYCLARQFEVHWRIEFFTTAQLAEAAVLAAAIAYAARRGWLTRRRAEPRALRAAIALAALAVTAVWFLSYLNSADTICSYGDCYNTAFMADETFAVLNGLTPLVNHSAAYGSLWPLLLAPPLALLGKTLLAWTILMWALTVAMLLALYGVLRRVTQRSLATLALYLPVMMLVWYGASRDIHQPIEIYQQVPLRTAGPFLVAWLVARRLDRARGAVWPLGLAAGLAAIDNADFGLAALGATVAALLWAQWPLSRARLARLAAELAVGLAGAVALVALVTLVRAGTLPQLGKVVAFARVYTRTGVGLWPLLRLFGLPFAIYLTYAGAIGVATVRALRGAPNRTLTGMLAWSGIFGFGSAAYYMGASTILAVATLFPAWALCLALLTVVAVQSIARAPRRLPGAPALAALFGFGLMASFALTPPARLAPWSQLERVSSHPIYAPDDVEPLAPPREAAFRRFVSSIADGHGGFVMRRGAPVAFLTATGHLIADGYGLRDVVPFTGRSVFTADQFDEAIAALRAAGGNTVLVPRLILPRVAAILASRGFEGLTRSGPRPGVPGHAYPEEALVTSSAGIYLDELTKWVDRRALP